MGMNNKLRSTRSLLSLKPPISTPPSPTATTPPHHQITFKAITKKRSIKTSNSLTTKRTLLHDFHKELTICKSPLLLQKPFNSLVETSYKIGDTTERCWRSLGVGIKELKLDITFPTGQTFRWKKTGPSEYTGAVGTYLFTLRQVTIDDDDEVEYFIHNPSGFSQEAELALKDYLNLSISLTDMWKGFAEADSRFAALAPYMGGARLLRQDPVECLFQFICSSNNNIQRITQMVGFLSGFGPCLGTVEGTEFHAFPSLEELSSFDEGHLRKAGFGYRAKYIVGAVECLKSKCGGGKEWLLSLRNLPLEEAIEALCTLPGIGPKVAACVALFSLDQHHAIPVDTHVWQLATRYITPELSGERFTPKLSRNVSEAFVKRFGKYAGWAQTVLFIAELSSQQAILPQHLQSTKGAKSKTKHEELIDREIED